MVFNAKPETSFNIGIARVLFFSLAFIHVLTRDNRDLGLLLDAPQHFYNAVSFFKLIPIPLGGATWLTIVQVVWKASMLFCAVGLFTRYSLSIALFLSLYVLGYPQNFGKVAHTHCVFVFAIAILLFSRGTDSFSLDRWLKKRPQYDATPSVAYAWPKELIVFTVLLTYFIASLQKLRYSGLAFVTSDTLTLVFRESGMTLGTLFGQFPPWFGKLMGTCGLLTEASAVLGILFRPARKFVLMALFGMQAFIHVAIGPEFIPLLICYVLFIPWDAVAKTLGRPAQVAPSAAPSPSPRARWALAYIPLLVLFVGHTADAITARDDWPFGSYRMYAYGFYGRIDHDNTFLVDEQNREVEVNDANNFTFPLNRVAWVVRRMIKARQRDQIPELLHGILKHPSIGGRYKKIILYQEVWRDASWRNYDPGKPDERNVLYEVSLDPEPLMKP